jgi:acyl-coenzyme A thioesterase PaaI-like protein
MAARSQGIPVAHYPRCFGCGTANPRGMRLAVRWDGARAKAEYVPPADAEGGPGVVHGGYLGAIADEVMSLAATNAGEVPAMTRRIVLDYRAPTLTEHPIEIEAKVVEQAGRKIVTRLVATSKEYGHTCFEASGIYIKVPVEAWLEQMAAQGLDTSAIDFSGGDPSNYFRWQLTALREAFRRGRLDRPVTVSLVLEDVTPAEWRLEAGPDAFRADELPGTVADVSFRGSFAGWQAVLDSADQAAAGTTDGAIEGDPEVLRAFVRAFEFRV